MLKSLTSLAVSILLFAQGACLAEPEDTTEDATVALRSIALLPSHDAAAVTALEVNANCITAPAPTLYGLAVKVVRDAYLSCVLDHVMSRVLANGNGAVAAEQGMASKAMMLALSRDVGLDEFDPMAHVFSRVVGFVRAAQVEAAELELKHEYVGRETHTLYGLDRLRAQNGPNFVRENFPMYHIIPLIEDALASGNLYMQRILPAIWASQSPCFSVQTCASFPNFVRVAFPSMTQLTLLCGWDTYSAREHDIDIQSGNQPFGIAHHVALQHARNLRYLGLSHADLKCDRNDFVQFIKGQSLTEIYISFCDNGDSFFKELMRSETGKKLEKVTMCNTGLTDGVATVFEENICLENLRELNISRNEHTDETYEAVMKAIEEGKMPKLRKLKIDPEGRKYGTERTWAIDNNERTLKITY